jgi:hypothetical protein
MRYSKRCVGFAFLVTSGCGKFIHLCLGSRGVTSAEFGRWIAILKKRIYYRKLIDLNLY